METSSKTRCLIFVQYETQLGKSIVSREEH
ncbi:hypothetical protein VV99743_00039 [Vibrio vulnificus]|nr:hypothetical protein VV99743_00039 [Vibrio vulnificus]